MNYNCMSIGLNMICMNKSVLIDRTDLVNVWIIHCQIEDYLPLEATKHERWKESGLHWIDYMYLMISPCGAQ